MISEFANEPLSVGDILMYKDDILVIQHFTAYHAKKALPIKTLDMNETVFGDGIHHFRTKGDCQHSIYTVRPFRNGQISHVTIRRATVKKIPRVEIEMAQFMDPRDKQAILNIQDRIMRGEKPKRI